MNPKKFIKSLFHDVWLGNDLDKIPEYYDKNVKAVVSISEDTAKVKDIHLGYEDICKQAKWQKENTKDINFDFKDIFGSADGNKITIYLFSSLIDTITGQKKEYRVCAFYELNAEQKIIACYAVMTPYYPFEH